MLLMKKMTVMMIMMSSSSQITKTSTFPSEIFFKRNVSGVLFSYLRTVEGRQIGAV